MAVEDGNSFLGPSNKAVDAFAAINTRCPFTIRAAPEAAAIPLTEYAQATTAYFTAGIAFLANRTDNDYLEKVGTSAWNGVAQERVVFVSSIDMITTATEFGFPPNVVDMIKAKKNKPHALISAKRSGESEIEEGMIIFFPPEFMITCQTNPIDALGQVAYLASHIRDFVNNRHLIDPQNMEQRAHATEAHFLRYALQQNSHFELNDNSRRLLSYFPNGIDSLPVSLRYQGNTGSEAQNFKSN